MINSYYEVEYQGEKYYCNIHLMPYHTFRYDGTIYVLNVERMSGYKISENFSKVLDKISTNPNIPVIRTIIEELNKLELINETPSSQGDDRSKKRDVVATLNEMPVHAIALNVAQSCNMKCVYCFGNGGEYGEEGFMEEETALRTVDWLIDNSKDSKQISITFFGGEPLMNFPLIQRVVEYAKKKAKERQKGVRFGITTNATLFNDNVIAYLKENKINPVISFDGYEAVQNVNRPFKGGQGSYKSVVKNIKKLLCVMPQSLCRSTIYGTTSLDKVKETIRRVGFSNYHLFEASPKINEEIKEFSKIHAGLMDFMEKEAKELLISIKNRNVKNMNTRIKSIISDILFKRKRHYGCGAGKGYLSISSSGDFYPCHRFVGTHEMKMGSIHDGRPDRKEYQKGLVTYLHKCSTCWAKYFCGGGCLYLNKATTGAIFEPDNTFCQEQQFLAELGIYVCCELDKSDITFLKDCKKYS